MNEELKARTSARIQSTKRSLFQRIARILTHRLFFDVLFMLVQIAVLAVMILAFSQYFTYFYGICILLTVLAVIAIIAKPSHPDYKIAWIVPILALPIFGGLLYLLFGGIRLNKRTRKRMERLTELQQETMGDGQAALNALPEGEDSVKVQSRYITRASLFPPHQNTQTWYYPTGEALYARMLTELEQAEHSIFLEYFIIHPGVMWDGILEILERKAAQGVDVRVLYDDIGCLFTLPKHYAKTLQEKGIACKVFNPFRPVISLRLNNRDHRKICVIDGHTAFTGGVNLADEYINEIERFGHWKDCGILVRGKAVWSMTVMFLSLWGYVDRSEEDVSRFRADYPEKRGGTGFLQPFADSPLDNEDVGATILQSVISSAQERMWIMTPYLILDDKMTTALCVAAKTGVDVRIITPGIPDKWYVHAVTRANYEELTRAGVRIFEYTPGFIHSKVYLADTKQAVVGTVNLDFRSLYLHFEDAVYLYDTTVNAQVQADFEETFPQCREITAEQCRHTHLTQRVLRALLRLLAPLM